MVPNTLQDARSPRRRAVLAAAVLLVSSLVAVAPGVAQESADGPDCLPAGGVDRPFETPEDFDTSAYDLIVNGGGFGHGVGMSQYGARGAAKAGCTYPTILGTYYPGTEVAAWPSPDIVRIGLRQTASLDDHRYVITSEANGGLDVQWHHCDVREDACDPDPVVQAADDVDDLTWFVRGDADAQEWVLERETGPADARVREVVWRGGDLVYGALQARHEGTVTRYSPTDLRNKWGLTQFDYTSDEGGKVFVTEHIPAGTDPHTGDEGSAVDRYLWGLQEVPLGWPAEALKAQAVAGRSYALAKLATAASLGPDGFPACRCDLRPTTVDQHWTGFTHELADRGEGHPWRAAVQGTADLALTYDADPGDDTPPVLAETFYSSSHGGSSDAVEHVWGFPYPYLLAVDTSRWECIGDDPNQRWTRGFTRAELADRFGLDALTDIVIEERGDGGRPVTAYVHEHGPDPEDRHEHPAGAVVTGTIDGETVTTRYSGEKLRTLLKKGSVSSALLHLTWTDGAEPQPEPSPTSSSTAAQAEEGESSCVLSPEPDRVSGAGRIGTAVAASVYGWDGSDTVVIARADHPADALAGSGLAGSLDAPLLITPTDVLDPAVRDEVNRLGATSAFLLGGEAALGPEVEAGLLADTTVDDVQRAEGPTRMHTAAAVADRLTIPDGGTALLVRGQNAEHPEREWPDALSVAAIAAHKAKVDAAWPVLLTGESLPDVTLEALERHGIGKVYAIGGSAVVTDEVVADLEQRGYEVERIAGSDRWGTSRDALAVEVGDQQVLVAATGLNFPDGLAAGPLAARLGGRLLLVTKTYDGTHAPWLADEHPAAVSALGWDAGQVVIVGGDAVVESAVGRALRNAL